ncbi:unnamed protein product, partial [Meganyctiphanes norvegica]
SILQGIYNYYVSFDLSTKKWKIIDFKLGIEIAQTIKSDIINGALFPVGRQYWRLLNPICGQEVNHVLELCFTACDLDQFTCSDGDCIPIVERCDFKANCNDFSDEENCNILSKPSGYAKHISPNSNLSVEFNILRFPSIGDTENNFEVEF